MKSWKCSKSEVCLKSGKITKNRYGSCQIFYLPSVHFAHWLLESMPLLICRNIYRYNESKLMNEEEHLLSAVEDYSTLDDSKAEVLEDQEENDVQKNKKKTYRYSNYQFHFIIQNLCLKFLMNNVKNLPLLICYHFYLFIIHYFELNLFYFLSCFDEII